MSEIDLDQQQSVETEEAGEIADRCRLLGIEWMEKAPETDEGVVNLIEPDVAVRLRLWAAAPLGRWVGEVLEGRAGEKDRVVWEV